VCNSIFPLPGVGMMMLGAIASDILNSNPPVWLAQWGRLAKGEPNPGLLEADPEKKDRALEITDTEELRMFARNRLATPYICFDFLEGGDNIPGLKQIFAQDTAIRQHFLDTMSNFFKAPREQLGEIEMARQMAIHYDGIFQSNGQYKDSRYIDYLDVAASQGFAAIGQDPTLRAILLGNPNPQDLAKVTQQYAGGTFKPVYANFLVAVNNGFLAWIAQKTQMAQIRLINPSMPMSVRPFGSIFEGFGAASAVMSPVGSGQRGNMGFQPTPLF